MTDTPPTAPDEPWHGTLNGYKHKKCRCDLCKNANRAYVRAYAKKVMSQPITGSESWHGTYRGYIDKGCRCDLCKDAKRAYAKKIRSQPITGSESWHGHSSGYDVRGCRCSECLFAGKIYRASRKFGLSKEKVLQLLRKEKCEICETETSPNKCGFHIDHDHSCCPDKKSCGKCVRGLLCQKCNSVIGFAKDDPEILKAAISYLERYSA